MGVYLRTVNEFLNVVDWDHRMEIESNNSESNCQALCPNCHGIKQESARNSLC